MAIRLTRTQEGNCYVQWDTVRGTEHYRVQISDCSQFNRVTREYVTREKEYSVGQLDNTIPQHVRVLANFGYGERVIGQGIFSVPLCQPQSPLGLLIKDNDL